MPDNVKMTLARTSELSKKKNLHRLRTLHSRSIQNEIEPLSSAAVGKIDFLTLNSLGFFDIK